MTYCVAIAVEEGLVFCSDSRTSAGMDQVSSYSKMHRFGIDGERQFVLLTSGNLGTTQAVIARLKRDIETGESVSLNTVGHMVEAADYLGEVSLTQQRRHEGEAARFEASFIIGGQIRGAPPELYLVYPEGNHITTSDGTPYLQIGESKYGKPILDRILERRTPLETAALCALVSMDSTMRSNLTVGPPIELLLYRRDALAINDYHRFDEDSEYLRELKRAWHSRLKTAFKRLPPINWAPGWDRSGDEQNEVS